jgi:hypothetical protein
MRVNKLEKRITWKPKEEEEYELEGGGRPEG